MLGGGPVLIVLLLVPQIRFSNYMLPAGLVGIALGTLIVYPLLRNWLRAIHRETKLVLQNSTMPSQLLDDMVQQQVLEIINSARLLKEPSPKTVVEQFQFVARFWSDYVAVATNADSVEWTPAKRRLFYHDQMDEFFEPTRLKAICEYFLAEDPTTT